MKRDPRLVCLSREHHDGLVMSLRIGREAPEADERVLAELQEDLLQFWEHGLLRHFRAENECLLARLVRHVAIDDELVRRTHEDHLRLEALAADMRDSSETEVRRQALLRFGEVLREHIRWEEEQLFEVTQRRLRDREMEALGGELEQRLPPVCFTNLFGRDAPPAPGEPEQ
jgi:hemerythrin-like domain-containing protein